MCTPVIAGAVGIGVSAYASYRQQQAQNAALEYNARVADVNARLAEQQAEQAAVRGARAERELRAGARQLEGAQRVGFAAAGVTPGGGSPLAAATDVIRGTELDAMDIRYNTALERWGYRVQAGESRAQARFARASRVSPFRAALPTLLGGTSQLALQFFGGRF